jgi:hypothetical protein
LHRRRRLDVFKSKAAITALAATLVLAGFACAKTTFTAKLTGDREVPPVVTETTGRFEIQFKKKESEAQFTLRISDGVRITQAHLHCGPAGVNGPVVVVLAGFYDGGWDVDGAWISNVTLTDASIANPACGAILADLAQQMRNGNVYVNAHSVEHPDGVIRGQIGGD